MERSATQTQGWRLISRLASRTASGAALASHLVPTPSTAPHKFHISKMRALLRDDWQRLLYAVEVESPLVSTIRYTISCGAVEVNKAPPSPSHHVTRVSSCLKTRVWSGRRLLAAEELDLEDEGGVGRDDGREPARAVRKVRRARQLRVLPTARAHAPHIALNSVSGSLSRRGPHIIPCLKPPSPRQSVAVHIDPLVVIVYPYTLTSSSS